MSGFAVFSLKEPSLLAFDQRRETDGNLESIYHVKDIPCDTQMRSILDEVNPEEIRHRGTQVKVIMVTALDDPKNVFEALYQGGATSYIVKPIDKEKLLDEIRDFGLI